MVRRIKTKLVLELRAQGITGRMIAHTQGISRNSVAAVFDAADRAGIGWDSIAGKSDAEVYALVFPGRGEHESVFVHHTIWVETGSYNMRANAAQRDA